MPGRRAFGLTRLFVYGSGLASAVAMVTIIAFFSVGQPWGTLNDFAYGIMTLAMLPVVVAIRRSLGRQASGASVWIVGLVTLLGYSAVSFLEVAQEVGLLSLRSLEPIPGLGPLALGVVFFALFEVWLLTLGAFLKRVGIVSALKMSLIAATAIAYPMWAVWFARQRMIWTQHSES